MESFKENSVKCRLLRQDMGKWVRGGRQVHGHYVPRRVPSEGSVLVSGRKRDIFFPCDLGYPGCSHSRIIGSEETSESISTSFKVNVGLSRSHR